MFSKAMFVRHCIPDNDAAPRTWTNFATVFLRPHLKTSKLAKGALITSVLSYIRIGSVTP